MCDCNSISSYTNEPKIKREESQILNKWVTDDLGRYLLLVSSIYNTYNELIGYTTKTREGVEIRIFSKNIVTVHS